MRWWRWLLTGLIAAALTYVIWRLIVLIRGLAFYNW